MSRQLAQFHCNDNVAKPFQALAFGYFEVLLRTTDRRRIERESARLKSYNTLLNTIGYEEDLYIDFVQETLDLLERTAANIGRPDGEQLLLASFNDESVSNSIITHFRVSRISWRAILDNSDGLNMQLADNKRVDEVKCCSIRGLPTQFNH